MSQWHRLGTRTELADRVPFPTKRSEFVVCPWHGWEYSVLTGRGEGNYSKAAPACTWPCAITERDSEDRLAVVYEALVHWADIVLIGTPWWSGRSTSGASTTRTRP